MEHIKRVQHFYPLLHVFCETTLPQKHPQLPPHRKLQSPGQDFLRIHLWSQVIILLNCIFNYRTVICKHMCAYMGTQLHIWCKRGICSLFCFITVLTRTRLQDAFGLRGFCLLFTAKYGCRNGYVWAPYAGSSHIFKLDNKAGKKQLIHKRDRLDSAPSVWLNLVLAFPMGL